MATANNIAVVLGACGVAVLIHVLILTWIGWFRAVRKHIITPHTPDDLSFWFRKRFWFWSHLVVYSRRFPAIHQYSMKRTGRLIAPLPVRLQDILLEGKWTDFDKFMNEHLQVRTDCTNQEDDLDCLERNLPEPQWCPGCRDYDRVLRLWETTQEDDDD